MRVKLHLLQITSGKHTGAKRDLYVDHLLSESFSLYYSAMAVYARSPSAYAALKNLEIVQLPCEKQVKNMVNANSIECGIDEKAIE